MIEFLNERVNEVIASVSLRTSGGPRFSTRVVPVAGKEQRNENWSTSHGRWEFDGRVLNSAQLKLIQNFFWRVRGKLLAFPFKDWTDYTVAAGEGFATLCSDGIRLTKRYGEGPSAVDRIVGIPLPGFVLKVNGDVQFATADPETGLVSISGGSFDAADISWTGEFDCRVRFDVDELPLSFEAVSDDRSRSHVFLSSLPVVELV